MNLSVAVRKRLSVDFVLDVASTIVPGITIVFGASGSGKSTLLQCISGLRRPDGGRIAIGDDVLFDSAAGIDVPVRHRGIGYVFQDLALFPHMSIADNLRYGLTHLAAADRETRIEAIADSFRIAHALSRRPSAVSGGERQRAALARSLVTNPSLLLLDEPLTALDHATQSRIIEDLRVWNSRTRIPILYVTHSHREVFALGEGVIVLEKGRIVAEGTPFEVMESPQQEALAQLAGFENFFDARVLERKPEAGTMHCQLEGANAELEAPLTRAHEGAVVRIAIRGGDILLATEQPRGLSARNVLRGRLTSIRREGATAIADVDAGAPFVVHLTPTAVEALGLTVHRQVWLIIKTHSCRIVS